MAVATSRKIPLRRRRTRPESHRLDIGALVVFALIGALGPLAFGAVDQIVQIGLLVLLSIGLLFRPPESLGLSRKWIIALLAVAAVLLVKEFGPAALFGQTQWRKTLVESYGLPLLFTHHPEPGRAFDALLAAIVALIWFLWVRTLAGPRAHRAALAWSLFGGGALVAAVSFATRATSQHEAIYGLRYTIGWQGFGPFPNRNHSGCYFAMTAVLGCGCVTWALISKKYVRAALGLGLLALIMAALLATQSRGGLIALAVGGGLYLMLACAKSKRRKTLAMAGLIVGVFAVVTALFGGPVIARFTSRSSEVSNATRVELWKEALVMWRDAPLFGHGAASFPSVFPMYQQIQLDNQIVLHPESSWLQWLTELGLLPVLCGTVALLAYMGRALFSAFARRHSFFLLAAGFSAAAALLAHCAVDTPGHRWGTAGIALAALAIASPRVRAELEGKENGERTGPEPPASSRALALVPLAIAGSWALPLLTDWPAWSPLTEARLISRAQSGQGVTPDQLERELLYFPLDPSLQLTAGGYELAFYGARDERWRRHFRLASRLQPGSWGMPMAQARACGRDAPGYALSYWQQAIDRSGWRAFELLQTAISETHSFPGADRAWAGYAEAHPSLLLSYAQTRANDDGRPFYDQWWKERGSLPAAEISTSETEAFYGLAARWGSAAQIKEWIARHGARADADYRQWAALLYRWGDDEAAWGLVAKELPDPAKPANLPVADRGLLEARWRKAPQEALNAQMLICALLDAHDADAAREVAVAAALRDGAPPWFLQKAAHLLAAHGEKKRALEILLPEAKSQ